jgi:hypothetical protein
LIANDSRESKCLDAFRFSQTLTYTFLGGYYLKSNDIHSHYFENY